MPDKLHPLDVLWKRKSDLSFKHNYVGNKWKSDGFCLGREGLFGSYLIGMGRLAGNKWNSKVFLENWSRFGSFFIGMR